MEIKNKLIDIPETECNCSHCRNCCKYKTCWGTPQEMEAIIAAGYGHKLMLDYWCDDPQDIYLLCPASKGYGGKVAPFNNIYLPCVFYSEAKGCFLHNKKLKPIEGRLANHKGYAHEKWMELKEKLVDLWNTNEGKRIIKQWRRLCL